MARFTKLLTLSLIVMTWLSGSSLYAQSNSVGGNTSIVDSAGTTIWINQLGSSIPPTFITDTKANRIYATNIVFTILAGAVGVAGSADGIGTNASFNLPLAVAVDENENVYIADSSNNLIRKINSKGVVTTMAGAVGVAGSDDGIGTNATFNSPEGVAVDSSGNVYVADTGNRTIREIDSNGVVSTIAGHQVLQQFQSIQTLRETNLPAFYGSFNDSNGIGTNAVFSEPVTVALDASTNIYVADQYSGNVRMIDSDEYVSTIADFGAGGAGPIDLTVDKRTTNIFVIDQWIQCICKISPFKTVTTLAGRAGVIGDNDGKATNASFDNPQGITVDALGNVYVSQRFNNIIRKIDWAGNVTTIAGNIGFSGSSNGVGTNATFNAPGSMTVDHYGNLYVVDTGNNTIRKGTYVQNQVQTISFPAIAPKRFDSYSFQPKASASSGLPIVFSSSNTNVATLSGNTITFAGAGTTTISATQNGYASFKAASPVSRNLVIEKAAQTISLGKIPVQNVGVSPIILPPTSSVGVTIIYTSSNPKVASVSSNSISIVGVGLANITAFAPATANYSATTFHQVLTVKKDK